MITDTGHSDSASEGEHATPVARDDGRDELGRLRAGLACGPIPVEQVRPLLDLLDVLRRAGGAEDRAARCYPGTNPLDLACRYGYVAASLIPALRVYETLAGSR